MKLLKLPLRSNRKKRDDFHNLSLESWICGTGKQLFSRIILAIFLCSHFQSMSTLNMGGNFCLPHHLMCQYGSPA